MGDSNIPLLGRSRLYKPRSESWQTCRAVKDIISKFGRTWSRRWKEQKVVLTIALQDELLYLCVELGWYLHGLKSSEDEAIRRAGGRRSVKTLEVGLRSKAASRGLEQFEILTNCRGNSLLAFKRGACLCNMKNRQFAIAAGRLNTRITCN